MTDSLLIKAVERLLERGVIVEPRGPVHEGVPIGGWNVRLENEKDAEIQSNVRSFEARRSW